MQQPQQPSAQQVQPDSRQQQQQQQQLQQQQQQSQQRPQPAASPPQQQQQQPTARSPQDIGWPSKLLRGLRHMPATLIAFILGGAGTWLLLWGWARGTPMRRSHPYCFTMTFSEASKLDVGTPIRMKGVQIGAVASVGLTHSNVEAVAQVLDSSNIIPLTSRVDINLLGLAADPWIDITPPAHASVRHDHGPHHPDCGRDGLIVCHNGRISGSQGGSTDFMMKFFLSQHDRTRVKSGEVVYHTKQA